jgi:hypothetical protein
MREIEIAPTSPARFRTVLAPESFEEFERTAVSAGPVHDPLLDPADVRTPRAVVAVADAAPTA